MFDYRLEVFHTVARLLNFNRAARELSITQPAVTRHIKELESACGLSLFDRSHRAVTLTAAGEVLLRHVRILAEQRQRLQFDLNALKRELSGLLRLGASNTLSQYVLPPCLAALQAEHPEIQVQLTSGNSSDIQRLLLERVIDLGVIEGLERSPDLVFHPYAKDEVILVTRAGNPRLSSAALKLADLRELSFVGRELGSGTADVVRDHLRRKGLDPAMLSIRMHLDGSEAIKNYLVCSDAFAFVSRAAVIRELASGLLIAVTVTGLRMPREFSFALRIGEPLPLSAFFMKYARRHQDIGVKDA